ncbi:MAG: chromosome segregation protein [Chlamydiales bacterium]
MRLKKIELYGFKSFADRTVLVFDEGITGIVGPNGCGKSNIIDAFRWVIGEQSAKSMRGDKMNDVIFAGASKRSSLNYAEVSLTFTEVKGALPIDFDEVSVSRRVYRSGDSEYRINRNIVRLKDVQSLFLGTGIGKTGFSIFEQGKIDQIILNNPVQRRYIFEEAAGILRFKQRKKEALNKLEQTQSNLERARDIFDEVKKRLATLSKQAEAARRFKTNKSNFEGLDKAVFLAKWEGLKARNEDHLSKQTLIEEDKSKHDASLEEMEGEIAKIEKLLSSSDEDFQKVKEKVFGTRGVKEVAIVEERSRKERVREGEARDKTLRQDSQELRKRRKDNEKEIAVFRLDEEKFKETLKAEEIKLKKSEKTVASAEKEIGDLRDSQKKSQKSLLHSMEDLNRWDGKLKDSRVRLESCQEKLAWLEDQMKENSATLKSLRSDIESKKKVVDTTVGRIDGLKGSLIEAEDQVADTNLAIRKGQEEQKRVLGKVAEVSARKEVLERLREEMEGLSLDTRSLLRESAKAKSPLKGLLQPLYERIVPKSGNEEFLATALRQYAQTIVVQKSQDREKVLLFAKENKLRDFSLFCVEDARNEKNAAGKISGASSLLDFVEKNEIAEHFLQDVYVVESIDKAVALSRSKQNLEALVEGGILVDRHSVLASTTLGEGSTFVREAEVKVLSTELKKVEGLCRKAEETLTALEQKKALELSRRGEIDQMMRREEMKLVEVNMFLQGAIANRDKVQGQLEANAEESKTQKENTNKFGSLIKEAEKELSVAQKNSEKFRLIVEESERSLEGQLKVLEELKQEYRECELLHKEQADEVRTVANSLNVLEMQAKEWERQQGNLEKELLTLSNSQEGLVAREVEYRQKLEAIEKELESQEAACDKLKSQVEKQKELLEQKTLTLRKYREKIHKLEEKRSSLGIKAARSVAELEALETSFHERYQINFEQASKMQLPVVQDLLIAEQALAQLRREIEKAGDVNMSSIDEYEQVHARHEFLNGQLQDIGGSQEELLKIIAKLDRASRKALKETFDAIRKNFKKNFEILFGGGEADLKLTESPDVLDAGIEIIAQPPGKQMRSISLLSGGEKCMTAMALLFAFFEVKPAPFCLLDEIDAPLDDSNIARFVDLLKQFIEQTQFVIVTHNKRTMSIVDILVGVSMQEKGVSKLLSLEFTKETESSKEEALVTAS